MSINKHFYELCLVTTISMWSGIASLPTYAQVASDASLSTEVETSTNLDFIITGGSKVENNLFHSFREFSIPKNGSASFENLQGVDNIISRVTGGSISDIQGAIKAQGTANLFLLNPNGIVFGPDAQLNIQGSFLATTANRIKFADGSSFSANETQPQPLLSIGTPIGLQFGENVKPIVNQAQREIALNILGLRVEPGRTLALLGGNITLENGIMSAPDGTIELGSVDDNSFVSLTPVGGSINRGWRLGYEDVQNFRDIVLSAVPAKTSLIPSTVSSVISETPGGVYFRGRNITITKASQVQNINLDAVPGGIINIQASESLEVSDLSQIDSGNLSLLLSETDATGDAGDIIIETQRLLISDGARINASSYTAGRSGNITINSPELVEVRGNGQLTRIYTEAFSDGDAGEVQLTTNKLLLSDGGQVSSSSFGAGKAGNLEITATNISLENGGKLTATSKLGRGGGNIFLQALNSLTLRRNSEISTDAKGEGNGGNITLDTGLLTALENSDITANAIRGRGGNIRIKTQGLFLSPDSEITATSERGVDGVVEIDRLENPENALLTLPAEPVNISGLIAQGCSSGAGSIARRGSEFVITGRGGLPPTPKEAFRGDVALADLGKPIEAKATQAKVVAPTNNNQNHPESTGLVEAQGWVIGSNGEVTLTASAPNVTPSIPWMNSNSCHG